MPFKTTEIFIRQAIAIHGQTYDYSQTVYQKYDTEILIICPKHGKFIQLPNYHLQGYGCKECLYLKKIKHKAEIFITKANIVHNNLYDYSLIYYENNSIPLKIICKKHGIFLQPGGSHLQGHGCKKCAIELLTNEQRWHTDEYILAVNNIHNRKYQYPLLNLLKLAQFIDIICPLHGVFQQNAGNHLQGDGCRKCGFIASSKTRLGNTQDFINKAISVHGNYYDYSEVKYTKNLDNVIIICPKHGKFLQSPKVHKRGGGCSKCSANQSKKELLWLDSINIHPDYRYYTLSDTNLKVDGFDPETNTVYEFFGDFWHGNPKKYKMTDINPKTKETYGKIYKNTLDRLKLIKSMGYNVIHIWEDEWEQYQKII